MPKVSVLTPIYNVEQYLPQCLDSLIAQSLDDIEFVCINDGSTDASLSILRTYAEKDSRFKVIDKPNSGYGASMNMGLASATGEYIGILEPDDFAEPNMFETLYQAAKKYDCEIARANRFLYAAGEDTFEEDLMGLGYDEVFDPADKLALFATAACIWSNLYKRTFLTSNEIHFLETPGASFQDTSFVYKSLIAAHRMVLIKEPLIHYRIDNEASSINSVGKAYYVCGEFDEIDAYLEKFPERKQVLAPTLYARRFQTYQWNYERLAKDAREDFLKRFASDFCRIRLGGLLSPSAFTAANWDRLHHIMVDPVDTYACDVAQSQGDVQPTLMQRAIDKARRVKQRMTPKDTILFFSNRGGMSENLQLVYDKLEGRKVVLAGSLPYTQDYIDHIIETLKKSKLIVLDDVCHQFYNFEIDKQATKVVQLWHACGAFKKFGLDNVFVPSWVERKKHEPYSLVSVSSEYIRHIYAQAFGISEKIVQALGVPRTDLLFDEAYKRNKRDEVYAGRPDLVGKKVVLYCPTFRQKEGLQITWNPCIDWADLSARLPEDVVIVVKSHPLEECDIMDGQTFKNIFQTDILSSYELLFVADLLMTDYSSIIFDATLLGVPIVFYCPDLDQYQTGFYFDFPADFDGDLVCNADELPDAILANLANVACLQNSSFMDKHVGACDGASTQRVVAYINEHFLW